MSAYNLETVIKKWGQGTLTSEQAIGQILLLVKDISGRIGELERQNAVKHGKRHSESKTSSGK